MYMFVYFLCVYSSLSMYTSIYIYIYWRCHLPQSDANINQIHTTGMDIKHVVNATAVITLGKDMIFRDYVQGAYRMRGIGESSRPDRSLCFLLLWCSLNIYKFIAFR